MNYPLFCAPSIKTPWICNTASYTIFLSPFLCVKSMHTQHYFHYFLFFILGFNIWLMDPERWLDGKDFNSMKISLTLMSKQLIYTMLLPHLSPHSTASLLHWKKTYKSRSTTLLLYSPSLLFSPVIVLYVLKRIMCLLALLCSLILYPTWWCFLVQAC